MAESKGIIVYDGKNPVPKRLCNVGVRNTLHSLGYKMYSSSKMNDGYTLCKEDDKMVDLADISAMWDDLEGFVHGNDELNILLEARQNRNKKIVTILDKLDIVNYKDPKNMCRFFFKNGVVEILRDGDVGVVSWDDVDLGGSKVWSSSVIDRDYNSDNSLDYKDGMFYKFCKNVAGEDGVEYLMGALGFILHSHKDSDIARALVLADGNENNNNKSNGGTGKSLIANDFLSIFRGRSFIDGKKFNPDDSFRFQSVNPESDYLVIDDVKQKFKYENIYPVITNDMEIERKNKDKINLKFSESPKVVITTNFGLIADGSSDRRRRRIIGLQNYYDDKITPKSEFGCLFFTEWVGEMSIEWDYLFEFAIECVRIFFKHGLRDYNHMLVENRAKFNALGSDMLGYCVCNYSEFIGEENCLPSSEIINKVKTFAKRNQASADKQFNETMTSMGFVRKSAGKKNFYTNEDNTILSKDSSDAFVSKRTTRICYYYELVDKTKLQYAEDSLEAMVARKEVKKEDFWTQTKIDGVDEAPF